MRLEEEEGRRPSRLEEEEGRRPSRLEEEEGRRPSTIAWRRPSERRLYTLVAHLPTLQHLRDRMCIFVDM